MNNCCDHKGLRDLTNPDNYYDIVLPKVESLSDNSKAIIRIEKSKPSFEELACIACRCARYFHREVDMHAVPPYEIDEGVDEEHKNTYILMRDNQPLGAFCMRKQYYKHAIETWALDWVWIHPYARGKGFMDLIVKLLDEEYDNWFLSTPLSPAMQAYVRTHELEHRLPQMTMEQEMERQYQLWDKFRS
jgi:hypothetical protein